MRGFSGVLSPRPLPRPEPFQLPFSLGRFKLRDPDSFAARLALGQKHERRVADELRRRRWTVDEWGQGVLSGPIRDAIRRSDSRLRFLPDLIAAQDGELVTIDCKDRMQSADTGRYAVSRNCVNFGLQLAALGVAVFYVFGDLGVLVPTEVMSYGRIGPTRSVGGAYFLVSSRFLHNFDEVFGRPTEVASEARG